MERGEWGEGGERGKWEEGGERGKGSGKEGIVFLNISNDNN